MRIIIAGGSGFLGRALQDRLRRDGHDIGVLTRHPRPEAPHQIGWTPDGSAGAWAGTLDDVDALVNLAGEGIADKRWTARRKRAIESSRLLSTRSLATAIATLTRPPKVFISGSGIGYYGDRGDDITPETTPPGSGFLAKLCVAWEAEGYRASPLSRVAVVRTAPVLHPDGGALAKMLPPFRLGLGGPLGSGEQYMAWIHLDDWVELIVWLVHTPDAHGAFNACAPEPVTNAEFTRTLGRVLERPTVLRVPGFALRLALGELANSLLTGQRAIPAHAEQLGFRFRHSSLEEALRNLVIS